MQKNFEDISKKGTVPFLLILAIIIALGIQAWLLNNARGPFWLGSNSDPEYVYLLNALNLATMKGVGHIDHPGTPVQVLGAVTLRLTHLITGAEGKTFEEDVLTRPEFYLNVIDWVMIILNACMIWLMGWVTIRLSHRTWAGIWMALAVFFSPVILQYGFTRVTPEPLLLFASSLMVMFMILIAFQWKPLDKKPWLLILFPAIIVGFGVAVKITFVPLALLPLFLVTGFKKRVYYTMGAGISFVIFTSPIIRMYPHFFGWIFKLLGHSGKYGSGASTLAAPGEYLANLRSLLAGNLFFTIVLIFSITVVILVMFSYCRRKAVMGSMRFRLLVGGIVVQVLGLLMVSKHSSHHYLLPVLNLSGVLLLLSFLLLKELVDSGHLIINRKAPLFMSLFIIVLSLIAANPIGKTLKVTRQLSALKEKSLLLKHTIDTQYNDYAKIFYYRCSTPEFGLKFGSDLSRSYHAETLQKLYKDVFFYDIWTGQFMGFDYNRTIPFEHIRGKYGDRIVFMGSRGVKIKTVGKPLKDVSPVKSYEGIFITD